MNNSIITSDFFYAVMVATARRIARLNMVDESAAANDYNQAVSAMTADEVNEFNKAIVKSAIELAA